MTLAAALAPGSALAALPEITGFPSDEGPLASRSFTLKTVGNKVVKCPGTSASTGGASAPKGVGMNLVMTGCVMGKASCRLPEMGAGQIVLNITGDLAYIDKAKKVVGVDLQGESPPRLAEFECGGVPVEVRGGVIARITPVNIGTSTLTFTLSEKEGVQKIKMLEGLSPDFPMTVFGSGPSEESGISLKATVTLQKPVTIKA
jgi:hypothetical protein